MIDENPEDPNRRLILGGLFGAGALMVALQSKVAESVVDASRDAVVSLVSGDGSSSNEIELLQSLTKVHWVDFDKQLTLTSGDSHHFYQDKKSPSFMTAIGPFSAAHKNLFSEVVPAREYTFEGIAGDVITFGSPVSNELMRQMLGYSAQSPDRLYMTHDPRGMHLPFSFDLSGGTQTIVRNSRGLTHTEPSWAINTSGGDTFRPRLTEGGQLTTDYLVISRLPHPSGEYGRFLLSFAGLHGPGTAATRLLISSPKAFDSVERALSRAGVGFDDYWQALVPVVKVAQIDGTDRPIEIDEKSIEAERVIIG